MNSKNLHRKIPKEQRLPMLKENMHSENSGETMNIEIQSIANKGDINKERLVLKITSFTNIGDYMIMQAGFLNGALTSQTYQTYWFPDQYVSSGDLVVLYTRSGETKQRELKEGRTVHFFYWGHDDSPIWDRADRAPVVLHAPEWVSKSPEELQQVQ